MLQHRTVPCGFCVRLRFHWGTHGLLCVDGLHHEQLPSVYRIADVHGEVDQCFHVHAVSGCCYAWARHGGRLWCSPIPCTAASNTRSARGCDSLVSVLWLVHGLLVLICPSCQRGATAALMLACALAVLRGVVACAAVAAEQLLPSEPRANMMLQQGQQHQPQAGSSRHLVG